MLFGLITPKYKQESEEVFDSALERAKESFKDTFSKSSASKEDRDAKFECISVYMCLYVWSLQQQENKSTQKLLKQIYIEMYDRFDIALREQSVSDVKVGPTVRAMASKFKSRLEVYSIAYNDASTKSLVDALLKFNVCDKSQAMQLAIKLCAEAAMMKSFDLEAWLQHLHHPVTGAYEPHDLIE